METNSMKARLLDLLTLLKKETDATHRLSTNEIIAILAEKGHTVERKTLYDDIALIKAAGYPLCVMKRRANEYYMEARDFDDAELMILIDAVKAARFITAKQTDDFVRRIASQAGRDREMIMSLNPTLQAVVKHTNEETKTSIGVIGEAISHQHKIAFKYFDLDEEKKRKMRRRSYLVNPIETVFADECLYLSCYDDKHANIAHYRIDRMTEVTETTDMVLPDERLTPRPDEPILFGMFSGVTRRVTLWFVPSLLGIIYDMFGEDVTVSPQGVGFITNVSVQVSPVFLGWCAHFPEQLMIIAPDDVVAKMRAHVKKLALAYEVMTENKETGA